MKWRVRGSTPVAWCLRISLSKTPRCQWSCWSKDHTLMTKSLISFILVQAQVLNYFLKVSTAIVTNIYRLTANIKPTMLFLNAKNWICCLNTELTEVHSAKHHDTVEMCLMAGPMSPLELRCVQRRLPFLRAFEVYPLKRALAFLRSKGW